MRKHRKVQTAEERAERRRLLARSRSDDADAADRAVDAMVRRSIETFGP